MSFDDILPLIFLAIFVANALRRRGGRAGQPPSRPRPQTTQTTQTPQGTAGDTTSSLPDANVPEARSPVPSTDEATAGDVGRAGGFDLERVLDEARRRVAEASGGGASATSTPDTSTLPTSAVPASGPPRPSTPPPPRPSVTPTGFLGREGASPPSSSPMAVPGQAGGFLGREGAPPAPAMQRTRASNGGSAAKRPLGGLPPSGNGRSATGDPVVDRRWTWDADAAVRGTVWNVALGEPASIGWARRRGALRPR